MLLSIVAVAGVALASQPFWEPYLPTTSKPVRIINQPVRYADQCYGCGCKGGPGWRVRLTGECARWKTLAEQCGDPPSSVWCKREK